MLHGPEQEHVGHIGQFFAHDLLRFDDIRGDAWDRAFVTNRAGQNNIDLVLDAGVQDAAGQNLFLHGRRDPATGADSVDGPHVVLVTAPGKRAV